MNIFSRGCATRPRVRASVRFGIGRFTAEAEIDRVAARVAAAVRNARADRPGAAALAARLRALSRVHVYRRGELYPRACA